MLHCQIYSISSLALFKKYHCNHLKNNRNYTVYKRGTRKTMTVFSVSHLTFALFHRNINTHWITQTSWSNQACWTHFGRALRGTMREASQKDKLTCVTLIHQTKQAKLIGYTDKKITNSVISLSPSLPLRTVLENRGLNSF